MYRSNHRPQVLRPQDTEAARIEHEESLTEPGPEDARLYIASGVIEEGPLTPAEVIARTREYGADDDQYQAARQEAVEEGWFLWRIVIPDGRPPVFCAGKDKNHAQAHAIMTGLLRPKDIVRDFDDMPVVEMCSTDTGNPRLIILPTTPEAQYTVEKLYSDIGWVVAGKVWAGSAGHALEIARTRWGNVGNFRAKISAD